jgi:hypothetical protein
MQTIQEQVEPPIDKKSAHGLYSKYMALSLDARTKGDSVLSEGYCQWAEYYLHLLRELNGDLPIDTKMAEPPTQSSVVPFRRNYLRRKWRGI